MSVKLSNIANIRTGLVLSRKRAKVKDKVKNIYNQITLKSIGEDFNLNQNEFEKFSAKEIIDSEYLAQKEDILIRLRGSINVSYIDKPIKNLIIPAEVAVIRVDKSRVHPKLLAYYLKSHYIQKELFYSTQGSNVNSIKSQHLANLTISLPSLEKQYKLIEFLDTSIKEIELLNQLIFEKKKYYNSVLEIFTKGIN